MPMLAAQSIVAMGSARVTFALTTLLIVRVATNSDAEDSVRKHLFF